MADQYLFCSAIEPLKMAEQNKCLSAIEPFWSEIGRWLTVILRTVVYQQNLQKFLTLNFFTHSYGILYATISNAHASVCIV